MSFDPSSSRVQRKELLKLSKTQLVKKCKSNKLQTNGSKGDLVNRLIDNKKGSNKIKKKKKVKVKSKSKSKSNPKVKSKNKKSNIKNKNDDQKQMNDNDDNNINIKKQKQKMTLIRSTDEGVNIICNGKSVTIECSNNNFNTLTDINDAVCNAAYKVFNIKRFNPSLNIQFRWLAATGKPQCQHSMIQYLAKDFAYTLEESIKIRIKYDNNPVIMINHYPTQNFTNIAQKYSKIVPSDVLMKFNKNVFSIYSSPNDIGLKENGIIKITNQSIETADTEITVKCLTGKLIKPTIHLSWTAFDLKIVIQDLEGMPPELQTIIFKGRRLDDSQKLQDYDIQSGDILNLVLKLRGS